MRLEPDDIAGLLDFAEDAIDQLRLPSGLFCYDRTIMSPTLRGKSVRYSIIVLLGLLRRKASGVEPIVAVDELFLAIEAHRSTLGVGDLGLLLWAEVRIGIGEATETIALLDRLSADTEALDGLEGMEAAWFVIGSVVAVSAGLPARALADRAIGQLRSRRSLRSPLFRHTALGRGRAAVPNFATEVYSLLALCEIASADMDRDALADAVRLADALIALRQPDGGWPWLFDADRAVVVEPYQVYSVHQDAMAPMALFALAEVSGDQSYAQAAIESSRWGFGNNELGFHFYDLHNRFAHRSIRREGWAQRTDLAINVALAKGGSHRRANLGRLTIETTCRPYHLGWVLEAWSGREHLSRLASST
jgi:hypothetical protein